MTSLKLQVFLSCC